MIDNLIKDEDIYGMDEFREFLNEEFITNTVDGKYSISGLDENGNPITRKEAWERCLKATYDFARSRLSYIFNQVMYCYEGAWKALEGLRVIESDIYEAEGGKEKSHAILREALGISPFLGEEVLIDPEGRELDLYHDLALHDASSVWTEDHEQVVMKGLAQSKLDKDGNIVRRLPLGKHYTTVSEAGLTRENNYVGNYGESVITIQNISLRH